MESWDNLLGRTTHKALDCGIDPDAVVDQLAQTISQDCDPSLASSTRVAEILLGSFDMADVRELPECLFELINLTLVSSYPPEPRNKVLSMWMIRTLTRAIETCPLELVSSLLSSIQDGFSIWVSDEYKVVTEEEFAEDVSALSSSSEVTY